MITWASIIGVIVAFAVLFQFRGSWQEDYTKESNYYTIRVEDLADNTKALILDRLIHSYNIPGKPTHLIYTYLKIFDEVVSYTTRDNLAPKVLYLGGGGYTFPQYMQVVYPSSVNEVVEIDPAVTEVAYEELGLPPDTSIRTYNQDARLFLMQNNPMKKYDFVIGDVFNGLSTPYHLTTLEFNKLVKANMNENGVYLINIIGDYSHGEYMPAMIYTLKHVFTHVYLIASLGPWEYARGDWDDAGVGEYVLVATDRQIDLVDYNDFIWRDGRIARGSVLDETSLERYLAMDEPILLTDDHAPTDILALPILDSVGP